MSIVKIHGVACRQTKEAAVNLYTSYGLYNLELVDGEGSLQHYLNYENLIPQFHVTLSWWLNRKCASVCSIILMIVMSILLLQSSHISPEIRKRLLTDNKRKFSVQCQKPYFSRLKIPKDQMTFCTEETFFFKPTKLDVMPFKV